MQGYLLDTHTIIWLLSEPHKLSGIAKQILQDSTNRLYYSLLSMNEIAIKASISKLIIGENWQAIYQKLLQDKDIAVLPLDWRAVSVLQHLPFYHKDPFDRMLIATAMVNDLCFLSADGNCAKYDLPVIW